jgi:4,5-DOPA dioxygenase extradiol
MMSRRHLLALGAFAAVSRRAFASDNGPMPAGYVGHGSPMLAVDPVRGAELRKWGASLPRPTGVIALTPHYRARGLRIGHVGKGHALYSFPRFMQNALPSHLDYPSPDNEALAHVVADLLAPLEPTFDEGRGGFDHTTWMPLMHLFPKADVPVVEIAVPFVQERELYALGRRLAPLRHRGIFVLASGSATHNLASMSVGAQSEGHSNEFEAFDAWMAKTLSAHDVPSILDWRARAPSAELVHPDDGGHFRVLLVALGAVAHDDTFNSAIFPVEGFEVGTQSKRCVELA